jgi:pilus assembly protein CpaE
MKQQRNSSAVISTDPAFRNLVEQVLSEPARAFDRAFQITVPFTEIGDAELRKLRELRPELIFLDLEADPHIGIKLAEFLGDQQPNRHFVAVGPVLGPELLLEAMRAGIGEYLPKPVAREALAAALQRLEKKLGVASGEKSSEAGRVLTFFSAKGGAGCTTITTNLAIHLHQLTGKKTLLVDLDLELGEVALFLGVRPRFNLADLVTNFHRMDAELLASFIERHDSGVHLLSAPYHPDKVESVDGDQFRAILQFLAQHYDYVLVDTPRSFSPPALVAFEQADQVFLIGNLDLPSLRNIKRSLPLLDRITGGNVSDKVRIIVNRHNSSATEISAAEVERALELQIFWKLSNDYEAVIRSINTGQPIALDGRGSAIGRDLRALAADLAGLGMLPASVKRSPLGGLFRYFTAVKESAA